MKNQKLKQILEIARSNSELKIVPISPLPDYVNRALLEYFKSDAFIKRRRKQNLPKNPINPNRIHWKHCPCGKIEPCIRKPKPNKYGQYLCFECGQKSIGKEHTKTFQEKSWDDYIEVRCGLCMTIINTYDKSNLPDVFCLKCRKWITPRLAVKC